MDEKEFLLKKNNNKNKISVNLSKKDINEKKVSKKNYKIVNNKKNLNDAGRLNKDNRNENCFEINGLDLVEKK